jgi:hypothetical protein
LRIAIRYLRLPALSVLLACRGIDRHVRAHRITAAGRRNHAYSTPLRLSNSRLVGPEYPEVPISTGPAFDMHLIEIGRVGAICGEGEHAAAAIGCESGDLRAGDSASSNQGRLTGCGVEDVDVLIELRCVERAADRIDSERRDAAGA